MAIVRVGVIGCSSLVKMLVAVSHSYSSYQLVSTSVLVGRLVGWNTYNVQIVVCVVIHFRKYQP